MNNLNVIRFVMYSFLCGLAGIACALMGLRNSPQIFGATALIWLVAAYAAGQEQDN